MKSQLIERFRRFQQRLKGSRAETQATLLQVTDLPDWAELLVRRDGLQNNYAKLFEPVPLDEGAVLAGRDEELASLEEALVRWEEGLACSVALIGPEGSGKSTLLNTFAAGAGARFPVLVTRIPGRVRSVRDLFAVFAQCFAKEDGFSSAQEVIRYIHSRARQVVVLEHGHNLSLRLVGCREALEVFFQILLATRQHWLWVVSFRYYPWERLSMMVRIQQFFTHQINLLTSTKQQIREIVESRHAQSGLRLEFAAENERERSQESLANDFFNHLFVTTGGNLVAVFYYWLLSLEQGEHDSLRVSPFGTVEAEYLRSLDRSYHFTLAEVVWHGGLSCREHQQLFLMGAEASRLHLEFLVSLRVLITSGVDADGLPLNYRLNPLFYKQVVGLLEALHLIY